MTPWLYVESRFPSVATTKPPILMVHGACSGPWVWEAWQQALVERGWRCYAPALRGHQGGAPADLSKVSMNDYLEDVVGVARYLAEPTVVMGWSMGGLLAFMFAALAGPRCRGLITLAPSATAETQQPSSPESVAAIPEVFGPDYYGIKDNLAATMRIMPDLTEEECRRVIVLFGQESGIARRERRTGISIPQEKMQSPSLILSGGKDRLCPPSLCRSVAEHYGSSLLEAPEASHLGIVMSTRLVNGIVSDVDAWLTRHVLGERTPT